MNNCTYQARLLNREIRRSNEYNQYQRTLSELKNRREQYDRTLEYRRGLIEIQMNGQGNTLDEVERLRDRYSDLLAEPEVRRFLEAEQRLVKMLRRVNDTILENIDLDTDCL